MSDAAWPALLGAAGLVAGSFLATLVIRWPQGRSVARGRSACDACGQALRAWELVPVLSALALRGRCLRCGARIDTRHLLLEIGCGTIGVASGWAAPGWDGAAGAAFGWLLLALAALDAAAFWLPDALVLPLALLGLVGGAAGLEPALPDRLIGGVGGFAGLWLVGVAYRRLRGRAGLGGGDPKLLGAIGLWLGWRPLPGVLLLACALGLVAALAGGRLRADARAPLGALLAAAAYPAWLLVVAGLA